MFGGGGSRRRLVALIAYYAVLLVFIGPMFVSRAGADTPRRIPVRISLNVALRTPTTDVATFTTPFPITVGVATDGTFTIPRRRLTFALVEVPMPAPQASLGRLTVRAAAMSDFAGTIDHATGAITLDGSLELLWTKPKTTHGASAPRMANCPVGPFALHLSTATVGGVDLNPVTRTARLVDDNLDVAAVPNGTRQCAGDEGGLNGALSLPILPKPKPTTTTTTTVANSTTTTDSTTTTTTTTDSTTTTTVGETTTVADPTLSNLTGTDASPAPVAPQVLAFEPIPSVVSMLTIAVVPPPGSTTTTTMPTVTTTPTTAAPHVTHHHHHHKPTVTKHHVKHHKAKAKHARTAKATTPPPVLGPPRGDNSPFFSPFNFDPLHRIKGPSAITTPLLNLGNEVARHRTGLSILFLTLLVAPLVTFGLGLVASDLGLRVPFLSRRRRNRAHARKTPA